MRSRTRCKWRQMPSSAFSPRRTIASRSSARPRSNVLIVLSGGWPVLTPALVQAATAAIKEVLASQSAWQVSCHSVLLHIFSNCNDAQAKRDALTADLTAIHDAEVKRLQDELATERAGIDAAVAKHLSDFQVKLASISD